MCVIFPQPSLRGSVNYRSVHLGKITTQTLKIVAHKFRTNIHLWMHTGLTSEPRQPHFHTSDLNHDPVCVCACTHAKLLPSWSNSVTLWTVAHQAPLSTGLSRQEHWSGCHALVQGAFPDSGIEPVSLLSDLLH